MDNTKVFNRDIEGVRRAPKYIRLHRLQTCPASIMPSSESPAWRARQSPSQSPLCGAARALYTHVYSHSCWHHSYLIVLLITAAKDKDAAYCPCEHMQHWPLSIGIMDICLQDCMHCNYQCSIRAQRGASLGAPD